MQSQRVRDDRSKTHHGFALVIALSLMALVLLLVLSITTLVQVETRSTQIHLHTLQTRESARLALMMAIGQLQEHARNDQRVTARAELLGDEAIHSNARFWTGVWDTNNMNETPFWLVSGATADAGLAPTDPMRLVGPGTVGEDASQYIHVPTIEVLNAKGTVSSRIGWWISDEGVKASVASLPLDKRPTPNFLNEDNALQLQLASTHGLEAIFNQYDRFSSNNAKLLDQLSSIEQLDTFEKFNESTPDTSREALFHSLTLNSYGVLASTTDGGLMQDLSLFPALLGPGLENYLQLGETHANQLAAQTNPLAKKLLFTDIVGLEHIGTLEDGDIATPIIPVLSNFMIAFTIRSTSDNENFLLRSKFFCEFWNPFTQTLSMEDGKGDLIDLELEITGFPEVTVHGSTASSTPINLQKLMGDPDNEDNAVIIRLVNDKEKPWFPGRSKNWVGLQTINNPTHSPYKSTDTETKQWPEEPNTLGGDEGIDTDVTRVTGRLRHTSDEKHKLHIKVYKITESSRELVSDLNGFLYDPVTTIGNHLNHHSGMTFGYHINLREPRHSDDFGDFFRGIWLKDHDPRSPIPQFLKDWHIPENTEFSGSPYISVNDGFKPINSPEPHEISETEGTINAVNPQRLLDRSKGTDISLDDLWQDAPLFELPRKRILSLGSLQHIYMHNERPFQVGNSWGSEGEYNTSEWFDHYYFSGLSRNDEISDFDRQAGPSNPCLQFVNIDNFLARFASLKDDVDNDPIAARNPAQHFVVANRFNINSTSVDAWKAVLSSLRLYEFSHLSWPNKNTSDLDTLEVSQASREQGSFTRFSHSLEETYQATASPIEVDDRPVASSAFYRHGARRFKSEEFEDFAQEIVRLIKQKGTPFKSMEEFLSELSEGNGSLLEQAIKNVFTDPISKRQQWYHDWETTGEGDKNEAPIDIDHFSPGFLTQADIMTAIGPMLAPRSDTFKIRARSECFDDFGERIGSATIEAVLQRTPEATNLTIPLNTPTDRKWRLTSVRWLQDDEI
ncbi:MAG: hypothetical protein ACJAYS_000976 [Lentimonas sp.]|jgi:hypothetical protein